jgi:uncharacterized protein
MLGAASIGIGLRSEIAADLLARPEVVDFVEVVAETCFVQAHARREARALAERWPVVPHGVKLSLGSADGIDPERARMLGDLARELGAPLLSEHVAITRGGRHAIGHLTPTPRTPEAVRVIARNVAEARRHLPDLPLLLENIAWSLRWSGDEMDEASFHAAIAEATGCDLLLDLGNLRANAYNEGKDPLSVLLAYPLERVAMVHLAGGVVEDGFYFDNHAAPVPVEVFSLLEALFARVGPVPVLLERDANFPPFDELAAELHAARAIAASCERPPAHRERRAPPAPPPAEEHASLARSQEALAALLTGERPPDLRAADGFDRRELLRARDVLQRKRIDDALPLLPRLSRFGAALFPLAAEIVHAAPRAPEATALTDALRIAEAARGDLRFARAAEVDRLILRARLVGPDETGALRPRRGPFVGRTRLPGGGVSWVFKGPGAAAPVRLVEARR